MDDRVQVADRAHRQTGVELLPRRHDGEPLREVGRVDADQLGHRQDGEHRRLRGTQMVDLVVVGVLVGDEHRGCSLDRLRLGPAAGVDDQRHAVVLNPDARVPAFCDPHPTQSTPTAPRGGHITT